MIPFSVELLAAFLYLTWHSTCLKVPNIKTKFRTTNIHSIKILCFSQSLVQSLVKYNISQTTAFPVEFLAETLYLSWESIYQNVPNIKKFQTEKILQKISFPSTSSSMMPPCIFEQTLPASSPLRHQLSSLVGHPPMQKGEQGPHEVFPCPSWGSFGSTQNLLWRSAPS